MTSSEELNRKNREKLAKPLIEVQQLCLYRGTFALGEAMNKSPPTYLIAPDVARATEMLRLVAVETSASLEAPNNPRRLEIDFAGEDVYIYTVAADALSSTSRAKARRAPNR